MRMQIYAMVLLVLAGCGLGIQSMLYIMQQPSFSPGVVVLGIIAVVLGVALNKTDFR